MKNKLPLLGLFFILTLSACTPMGLALSSGATLGVAAAQEGGIEQAATDAAIRLQIHDLWFRHSVDMYRRLNMTVKEGRVLVTGTVPDPDMRVDAVRLVWQADGVRQVINEVRVEDAKSFGDYAKDALILGELKSKLLFDRDVQSLSLIHISEPTRP